MADLGKEPIRVLKDVPGFVGNRMQHALQREAMDLVDQGIASPEDVDRVVKFGFGLRLALMGPLERADFDWAYQAMEYWPDRVKEKCKTDKSLTIAHGLDN